MAAAVVFTEKLTIARMVSFYRMPYQKKMHPITAHSPQATARDCRIHLNSPHGSDSTNCRQALDPKPLQVYIRDETKGQAAKESLNASTAMIGLLSCLTDRKERQQVDAARPSTMTALR